MLWEGERFGPDAGTGRGLGCRAGEDKAREERKRAEQKELGWAAEKAKGAGPVWADLGLTGLG